MENRLILLKSGLDIGFHLKIQNAILKARKVSGIRGASPNIKSFFQEKVLDYLRNAKRNTRRY